MSYMTNTSDCLGCDSTMFSNIQTAYANLIKKDYNNDNKNINVL